ERRFLYKVCFDKPSAYVRRQIWKGIIPSVTEETAYRLAKEFDFSGGQIENIARKYTVNEILYGAPSNLYITLRNLCLQESIQNHSVRPSIGFVA
ncbi:MAG: AAA family ATPase, partial [Muribaculaceae bacterium]|nr:AAA family ATPase [Muribaculaceae bacterium]